MLLNQPFPAYHPSFKTVRFTFYAGVVVFLVLALFQPFGFSTLPFPLRWLHAAYFGIITFVIATLNAILLPQLFPFLFKEEGWTTGKELLMMLWQIITISLGNMALMHILYGDAFSWSNILPNVGITAAVGIFPVTLIVLLKQQLLLKKYTTGAAVLDQQLSTESIEDVKTEQPKEITLHLTGENQNENLDIPIYNFRFITSADNYIKVCFLQSDKLATAVLRGTLKKAEAALQEYPQLFRCHRAYIVNLNFVEHISGNAQGYKLHVKDVEEPIPVSRSFNNELEELIQKHSPVSRSSR